MNRKGLILAAIALVSLIQLGAVGERILRYEGTLAEGRRYLFKTAPVDPYDIFRGRYVALSQESLKIEVMREEVENYKSGQSIWAQITVDEEGFARFSGVSTESLGVEEIRAKVQWAAPEYDYPPHKEGEPRKEPVLKGAFVTIEPPFSRYYMNEKTAPKAETAYRKASRGKAWIAVRVKDGLGVIEELYIEGKPVRQWLEENGG